MPRSFKMQAFFYSANLWICQVMFCGYLYSVTVFFGIHFASCCIIIWQYSKLIEPDIHFYPERLILHGISHKTGFVRPVYTDPGGNNVPFFHRSFPHSPFTYLSGKMTYTRIYPHYPPKWTKKEVILLPSGKEQLFCLFCKKYVRMKKMRICYWLFGC